ncbi:MULTISPECIES: hypothetical protein [unclassified Dysgonomonas]|uniref:hypothetical protein n=1 Tax=unclassified Dysgonomonas TaxID=2630389 RepID=UPI0025B8041F|nr:MULTISPECIES: hypothetical protein [unclassified Dysgonomonas]HMM01521.1 hypothetical protein [Dysgonomonas sp.]
MKQAICYILILLTATSCSSTYFFSTLNTNNEYVEKVDNGDFLLETDSLWIAYCFKGESAPIQITVFNKLSVPLYVDWLRSALILDGTAYSYAKDKLNFSGNAEVFMDNYNLSPDKTYSFADGSFAGDIESPQNISFIPPKTMISYIPLRLNMNFDKLDKKLYRNSYLGDKDSNAIKVKRIDYSESDSPLHFESYLTVYARPEHPMTFQQSFYMSNLIKTQSIKPSNLPGDMAERGDFFYIEKPANNTFWEILLGTTLVVGAVAIEVAVDANTRY